MAHEFEYLAKLTRNYFRKDCVPSRPPAGLDWSQFVLLCTDHKVAGTLLPLVSREDLSDDVVIKINEAQRLPTETSILNLLFLERILPELEKADCRPIVLKGGVLAPLYYPKPEQRFLSDLDILVERDCVSRACEVLKGLGLKFSRTVAAPEYYRDHHFHWILSNDVGFVVEIHWGLALPQSIYRFDLEGLRARSVSLPLNKMKMRALAPIDHLLHIVIQCSEVGFGEMRRVIDAALLYQAVENSDEMIRQAVAQNQGIALWLLLEQAERWVGVSLPEGVLSRLAPPEKIARILSGLADRMLRGKNEFRQYGEIHHLLHWLCAPTPLLRGRELWHFLSPGKDVWLELGFTPQALPGFVTRFKVRLSRFSTLLYLMGVFAVMSTGRLRPRTR